MQKRLPLLVLALLVTVIAAAITVVRPMAVQASDHDDGTPETKGKSLNLTDCIVFEKQGETGVVGDDNIISFIMTVNDRSVARQQYFFGTAVNYDMNVERVALGNEVVPPSQIANSGVFDLIFRFRFAAANSTAGTQAYSVQLLNGGLGQLDIENGLQVSAQPPGLTNNSANQTVNNFALNSQNGALDQNVTSFAGLREDSFVFDVEQYFRVRAGALGLGPAAGFRNAATARDFPAGYNHLAIVMDVPRALLASNIGTPETAFDFWATITR